MRWMEVQRGHIWFHTFNWTFVLRCHWLMKGMRIWLTLSNYERRFKKKNSISSCDDDSPVFKKKTQTFINAFYIWCVFPKHKIESQQSLISALIYRQCVLRIPKVLLTSNNPKVRRPGGSLESFRKRHCGVAPWREVTAKVSW